MKMKITVYLVVSNVDLGYHVESGFQDWKAANKEKNRLDEEYWKLYPKEYHPIPHEIVSTDIDFGFTSDPY